MPYQTKFGLTIEPQFAILHSDLGQGDFFIVGPFATRAEARKRVEELAVDHELDSGDTLERDDEPGVVDWITSSDPEGDNTHEWSVFTMIKP